ncbi:5'-methylthioadenosine/S-adenosylhomocysteine nucleosidase family protein [Micromonospora echinofusca]|uniref:Nucleoside phosphorylase domain-containing protein n=1 Tax=Micromonospora echinofusca TaxID=47858 RepID=A0ABS3VZI3_MICEH|nr:5'-methylthioadenosine/S-adenosylhomocysteine nucleosidase [Micromonospora echinofusca]MBO4209933.1 hypothetical protein [Micromonospora echinofusca]
MSRHGAGVAAERSAVHRRGPSGGDRNIGAWNSGPGTINVGGHAVGMHRPAPAAAAGASAGTPPPADIGILTVLPVETSAVVEVLRRACAYRTGQLPGGAQVHQAHVPTDEGQLRVVAMQTLNPGQRSATVAYQQLRRHFAPPVVLLVGIAGGIGTRVDIGDVVLADEVIYYDSRRETGSGVRRRGQEQRVTSVLRHRLDEFLRVHGEFCEIAPGYLVPVRRGPIGSGEAVPADRASDIRRYLLDFNDKTLAVETEAAGVAQAFHEEVGTDRTLRGWLTIRGISDLADAHKGDGYHRLAAQHAAAVLERLLPFLRLSDAAQ